MTAIKVYQGRTGGIYLLVNRKVTLLSLEQITELCGANASGPQEWIDEFNQEDFQSFYKPNNKQVGAATTIPTTTITATDALVGKTIKRVQFMTDSDVKALMWYKAPMMIELTDGTLLWPQSDAEGNSGGTWVIQPPKDKDETIIIGTRTL